MHGFGIIPINFQVSDICCGFTAGTLNRIDTALAYCSQKGVVGRGIDSIKSARGEATTDIGSLEIDRNYAKSVH